MPEVGQGAPDLTQRTIGNRIFAAPPEGVKQYGGRRFRRLSAAVLAFSLVTGGAVVEGVVTAGPAKAADADTYSWSNATAFDESTDDYGYATCPSNDTDCTRITYNVPGAYYGDGESDPWGYNLRNCTSYVAEKISQEFNGLSIAGWGNAADWATSAQNAGYSLDSSPEVGDIAVWGTKVGDGDGHVAYVAAVNDVGGTEVATFDEYNVAETGEFTDSYTSEDHPGPKAAPDWYIHMGTPANGSGDSPPPTPPNLYEVQHNNSSNGMTQVKEFNGSADFTTWVGGWTTPDGEHAGTDVSYIMSNDAGVEDIYEIQSENTASGMTEIKEFDGADNFTTWDGGWVSVDGEHTTDDVSYVVGTENSHNMPNIYEIQHQNTASGMTEVKEFDGADDYSTWVGGWVTPDGLHSPNDVDYVSSTCGTTGAPNIYEIQHNDTASGMTEIKEFDGADNYTSWVGGWTTPDGEHAGTDVSYVAAGCNSNGNPNIYEVQSQNTNSGMTEVKEFNGATDYTTWVGGWVTPDGEHSTADVAYVMGQ